MEEAQPLLPRNVDEIINQPAKDAAVNQPPSNNLSSSNKHIPKSDQPQPSDMEVYHHAHQHGKKNRTAYFWEFILLFLKVKGVNGRLT